MPIADPRPTFSPTSTASDGPWESSRQPPGPAHPSPASNTTLNVLACRQKLQERAEAEFERLGRKGNEGREFLDLNTIVKALNLRERGMSPADIESRLRLQPGVVARLGRPGVSAPLTVGA